MGSFVLIWPYRYGDKTYEGRAKFLKIEQVNYYYWPFADSGGTKHA